MIMRAVPNASIRRPTNGDPKATMMPAGRRPSAISSGDHPSTDCRKIVIMNWKLR